MKIFNDQNIAENLRHAIFPRIATKETVVAASQLSLLFLQEVADVAGQTISNAAANDLIQRLEELVLERGFGKNLCENGLDMAIRSLIIDPRTDGGEAE